MGRISHQVRHEDVSGSKKATRKINSAWEADNEDISLTKAKTGKSTVGDEVCVKG